MPWWCLTAPPCVSPPEGVTNNEYDVSTPPRVNDEVTFDGEPVFAVKAPVGEALVEFRTKCRLPLSYDQCLVDVELDVLDVAGAAAARGAATTANVTPIPAEANPIARSARTDTAIPFSYPHVKFPGGPMTLAQYPKRQCLIG